ncbi:MAG: hypothetical protein BGO49_01655 [Planctomycetales bacterium 71-10]|nr:MAG: hypothetical protein BGO49_01655 [Planctomycetales bacterium 71-10]
MPQAPERKTRLGRLLREHPEARDRLRNAVGGLLMAVLATIAAVAALSIWHLRRRADRIRDRLEGCRGCDLDPPDPRTETENSKDRPE